MSTLSVHRLENVQDFDMANTPFTTAFNAANSAFAVTNAAFNTTNTAYNFANTVNTFAYGVAVNSAAAFAAANNVAPQVTPAFLTGNLAYALANNAYASINSNWTVTNALYSVANSAYGAANNVGPQIAPTYNTANAAYGTANAAYAAANTKFSSSGGTISGAVEITADLTVHGNTRFVDQQTLSVGDPLIYLAANNYSSDVVDIGFVANYVNTGGANVHTGLYRSSGTKEYYLFYGYDKEPLNNYIDPTGNNITMAVLNSTVRTSNLILGGANAINWITSAYNQDNVVFGVSNAAFGKANNALANTSGVSFNGNFYIPSGNVGIGTTSPSYKLHQYGGDIMLETGTSGTGGKIYFKTTDNPDLNKWIGQESYWMVIGSHANEGFRTKNSNGTYYFSAASSGTVTATADFRAPIFYDYNDTGYYADPGSTSKFNALVVQQLADSATNGRILLYGNLHIDSFNGYDTYVNYYNSVARFRVYRGTTETFRSDNDGIVYAYSQFRTPIFYDYDNTGYYVDPASTTNLNGLNTGGITSLYTSSSVRGINFGSNELAWITANSQVTNAMWFNVCDSTGNFGQRYNVYLRGLASNGSASIDLASINLWANTVSCSQTFSTGTRGITKSSMPAGSILQVVQTVISSASTVSPNQTAVAVSGYAATITPTSSTSKIWILCEISYGTAGAVVTYGGYFQRNGTTIGIGDAGASQQRVGFGLDFTGDGNQMRSIIYSYIDSPASTSALTYQMWVNNDNGNILYLNRSATDSNGNTGKRGITTITLLEIAQ